MGRGAVHGEVGQLYRAGVEQAGVGLLHVARGAADGKATLPSEHGLGCSGSGCRVLRGRHHAGRGRQQVRLRTLVGRVVHIRRLIGALVGEARAGRAELVLLPVP